MKREKAAIAFGITSLGMVGLGVRHICRLKRKYDYGNELKDKIVKYYHILNKWLSINQNDKSLVDFFIDNEYKSIAIYGYKELGERLYDDLKGSEVEVKYFIDKQADNRYAEIDGYTPDEVFPKVDVVVVTASYYFEEIEDMLSKKMDCPIVSIDDVIYWCS